MADDTNNELATLLAADMPVSPAERDLAHRNRKLRQPVQPADGTATVDPRLVSMLASGGIGSDARMPVGPAIRPMVANPAYSLGGKRMVGQRPLTDTELTMPRAAAELTGVPQAADAIGEAYADPTLANVTDAGARTAIAALRPGAAALTLGAGYTTALAKDLGLFSGSPAEAQAAKKQSAPKQLLPGLDPAQQAALDAAEKKLLAEDYEGPAGRQFLKDTVNELRGISKKYSTDNADSDRRIREFGALKKQDEYDRAVAASEDAYKREMSRDRRFSDTETGKVYDKTGGLASVLAGGVFGAGSRLASGPGKTTAGSIAKDYVMPATLGGAAGAGMYNAPLAYNAFGTEPDNPKKRAYEARGEALPPDHPRRQEFLDYAKTLPEGNPVQTAAEDAFYKGLGKRSLVGALEGAGGGLLGADAVRSMSRGGGAMSAAASGVGSLLRTLVGRGGPQRAGATSPATGAGIQSEAGASLPMPTAGDGSSATILPPTATGRPPLADRVRAQTLPEPRNDDLARILAQDQLPSPSTPSSSDLVRALASPANRQLAASPPRSKEVRTNYGRPFAKDPDDGRFTTDPEK